MYIYIMEAFNPQPVYIHMDYRESRSGILDEFKKARRFLTYKLTYLEVGDYCVENRVLVERKTVSDFYASLKTDRIFNQAYRMLKQPYRPVIIIEGDNTNSSGVSRQATQGCLVHLKVVLGIVVLKSCNIAETANLIRYMGMQIQRNNMCIKKAGIIKSKVYGLKADQWKVISPLLSIQGVGLNRAIRLLNHFGSLQNIINAGIGELLLVEGVGKQVALAIHETFRKGWNRNGS